MDRTSNEQTLFTTGGVPLWIRLLTLPFAGLLTWVLLGEILGILGIHPLGMPSGSLRVHPVIGLPVMIALDVWLISPWFAHSALLYITGPPRLVFEGRFFIRHRRVVPIQDVTSLDVRPERRRRADFWAVSLVRTDGRRLLVTRFSREAEARSLATVISARIGR